MKKQDDYIAGPHHYWIHFWCGLVFGVSAGARIGAQVFDVGWGIVILAAVIAVASAISCGRWGDPAWHWVIRHLP